MWALSWKILCDTAVFVLVGFFIAGLMRMWLPGGWAIRWLSQRRPRSAFLATLVGAPLPLCSCGVLPAAVSLRKSGASKGATLSFLISTPETSVTSVLLTYSLLGPLMAIARPVAACITAVTAGFIENIFDRREYEREVAARSAAAGAEEPGSSCCSAKREPAGAAAGAPPPDPLDEQRPTFREAMRFAFVQLFDDIFGWIIVGVVVAAALQVYVPPSAFQVLFGNPWIAMLLMLVIGVPLYICAESSTPVAAALIAQGMSPGAALVLLLAGPATNIGSIGVLYKQLGRRTIIVYLTVIAVVAILSGWLIDVLVASSSIPLGVRAFDEPLVPLWFKNLGAAVFVVLGFFTVRRKRYGGRLLDWLDKRLPVPVTPASVTGTAVVVAALWYAGSGLAIVRPGEVGVLRRFGRIVRSDLAPGLHYAWPRPFERIDRVAVERVRRLTLGYRPSPPGAAAGSEVAQEALILVGDENIADVKATVHWGAAADEVVRYAYSTADREALVRAVALAALREVMGGESINWGFTRDRRDCERRIEEVIRRRLRGYHSGIRIDSFHFLDAHAPPEVHAAFRDVAGALEDRDTQINLARAREARVIPQARGEARKLTEQASGYVARALAEARGAAAAFSALRAQYRRWPEVTRRRLYYEMLGRVLPGRRKYIKTTGPNSSEVEIWMIDSRAGAAVPWPTGGDMR